RSGGGGSGGCGCGRGGGLMWTESRVLRPFVADMMTNTAQFDLDGDTLRVALFNYTITPDRNVASALSAYNARQWDNANEVFDAGQWDQGGVALTSPVVNSGSAGVVFFDADDAESGAAAELADVYGVLVYDDTLSTPVADQGICY